MSNAEFVKHANDSNFSTVVLKEESRLWLISGRLGADHAGQSARFWRSLRLNTMIGSTWSK